MPNINGTLTDVGFDDLDGVNGELWWHPRFESGSMSSRPGSRLFPSRPVKATLSGDDWTVTVASTDAMVPLTWYELEARYFDSAGNFCRSDWYAPRVFVGPDDSDFSDLPISPNDADAVLVRHLVKCVHSESGVWVWDGPDAPAATHYLIPDDTGALIARVTAFPTPSATAPELTW